jgi:hypothetical protein
MAKRLHAIGHPHYRNGFTLTTHDHMIDLPIEDENNSTELIRAILPMKRFTKSGIGVVLVHHARRGNSNVGDLGRGGGGLLGQVDHIVELRAFTPDDVADKRRIMSFKGRLGISERVIEWRGGGTLCLCWRQRRSEKARDPLHRMRDIEVYSPTDVAEANPRQLAC